MGDVEKASQLNSTVSEETKQTATQVNVGARDLIQKLKGLVAAIDNDREMPSSNRKAA